MPIRRANSLAAQLFGTSKRSSSWSKCASSEGFFCLPDLGASERDVRGPFMKSDVHRSTVRSDKAYVFPKALVSSLLKKTPEDFLRFLRYFF